MFPSPLYAPHLYLIPFPDTLTPHTFTPSTHRSAPSPTSPPHLVPFCLFQSALDRIVIPNAFLGLLWASRDAKRERGALGENHRAESANCSSARVLSLSSSCVLRSLWTVSLHCERSNKGEPSCIRARVELTPCCASSQRSSTHEDPSTSAHPTEASIGLRRAREEARRLLVRCRGSSLDSSSPSSADGILLALRRIQDSPVWHQRVRCFRYASVHPRRPQLCGEAPRHPRPTRPCPRPAGNGQGYLSRGAGAVLRPSQLVRRNTRLPTRTRVVDTNCYNLDDTSAGILVVASRFNH